MNKPIGPAPAMTICFILNLCLYFYAHDNAGNVVILDLLILGITKKHPDIYKICIICAIMVLYFVNFGRKMVKQGFFNNNAPSNTFGNVSISDDAVKNVSCSFILQDPPVYSQLTLSKGENVSKISVHPSLAKGLDEVVFESGANLQTIIPCIAKLSQSENAHAKVLLTAITDFCKQNDSDLAPTPSQ